MKKKSKLPLPLRFIRWAFPKVELVAPVLAGKWAWKLFFSPFRFPAPKKEQPIADSAKLFNYEAGNQTIQGYEWGNGEKTVLLLHGWSGRATQFYKFIEPLINAGYKVVSIDGPAHGKSTGNATHIMHYADTILKVKELYPEIRSIIAHSFGGAASMQAIRLGLDIDKLVNIGTPTVGDYIISDFLRRINGSQKSGDMFKQNIKKQFNRTFDEFSVMETIKAAQDNVNVLMIHDEDDKEVPVQHTLDLVKAQPWVNLIVTKKLGHMRILKDAEVISHSIDYLSVKEYEPVLN